MQQPTGCGWCRNDTELMSKIAAKMGELNMGPAKRPTPSSQVCQMRNCWQHMYNHLSACSGQCTCSARDLNYKTALAILDRFRARPTAVTSQCCYFRAVARPGEAGHAACGG